MNDTKNERSNKMSEIWLFAKRIIDRRPRISVWDVEVENDMDMNSERALEQNTNIEWVTGTVTGYGVCFLSIGNGVEKSGWSGLELYSGNWDAIIRLIGHAWVMK